MFVVFVILGLAFCQRVLQRGGGRRDAVPASMGYSSGSTE